MKPPYWPDIVVGSLQLLVLVSICVNCVITYKRQRVMQEMHGSINRQTYERLEEIVGRNSLDLQNVLERIDLAEHRLAIAEAARENMEHRLEALEREVRPQRYRFGTPADNPFINRVFNRDERRAALKQAMEVPATPSISWEQQQERINTKEREVRQNIIAEG